MRRRNRTNYTILCSFKLLALIAIFNLYSCSQNDESIYEPNFDAEAFERFGGFLESNFVKNGSSRANLENSELTEVEAKTLMMPLIDESLLFLENLGFEKSDVFEEIGDADSPQIGEAAISLFVLISQEKGFYSTTSEVGGDNEFLACLAEILPIALISKLVEVGIDEFVEKYGKRALVKIVGKTLGKTLGWVGLAYAGYELALCLRDAIRS